MTAFRTLAVLAMLALAPAAGMAQSSMGVLEATLPPDGPDGGWIVSRTDGAFTLHNASDATALRYYYADKTPDLDRRVAVDVLVDQSPDGSGFGGILFGFHKDTRHYSILALKADGTLSVFRRDSGGLSQVMSTSTDKVRPGWNRIEIVEAGDDVSFLLNGEEMGAIGSTGLGTGGFGIVAAGKVRASFANFTASDPDGPIKAAP